MRALLVAFVSLVGILAACGDGDTDGRNLLANAGFEQGDEPWFSLDEPAWGMPFAVSDSQASDGTNSALLQLRSGDAPTLVVGVVQDLAPDAMPETLSGSYYVERWEQGTAKQYLQAVVIVVGAENAPESLTTDNHQLRYVLAGVGEPPLEIGNARYVVVGDGVETDRWVSFEVDLHDDFAELWGAVPEGFESLRVLFELRWDERNAADGPSTADVYYDDLYVGPR